MFLEWNQLERVNSGATQIYFIEEVIKLSGLYKMAEQYDDVFVKKRTMDGSNVAESFEDTIQELEDDDDIQDVLETLTPEQRTIQWASQRGGATNL